jgi:hypothetical protein
MQQLFQARETQEEVGALRQFLKKGDVAHLNQRCARLRRLQCASRCGKSGRVKNDNST